MRDEDCVALKRRALPRARARLGGRPQGLAFTYFAPDLQTRVLMAPVVHMRFGGALVAGKHQAVPPCAALDASPGGLGVYWRR